MNKDQCVIEYIATAQDLIEKSAAQKQDFASRLTSKLNSMVKAGALSSAEAHTIMKEAAENPANVLNYLDIPNYQQKIASLSTQSNTVDMDPLEQFCRS